MEYKYPIETHNSVGFKNTSDFNNEAFNDYLHHDRQSNRSGYLTCSYDELKNLLGNPIKLSASFMYPETAKEIYKLQWKDSNRFHYQTRGKDYFLSDVIWFVNLTDYKYKGRKNADWFTIRNFGNGMNMERFLKKNHKRYSHMLRIMTDTFEDKLEYLKRYYSRYSSDSKTYDNGFNSASIWLDKIIKDLELPDGLCRYSPIKPKDNINWLISKYVYHGDETYREMNDTQQILNYYLEENRT
jgi:hypothetical protein|tara:strand:- start:4796 stop:5521 length:726 start_codon:yes stop_codon:yes gene_type:complete